MKKILLFFCLLALCQQLFAQNNSKLEVTGTLIDSLTGKPVSFANVTLQFSKSSKQVAAIQTDDMGLFKFANLKADEFKLIISSVEYETKIINPLKVDSAKSVIDLGKILLKSSARQLNEVTVVSQKDLIKRDLDKISYDVERDPDSKTNNTLEMLRKVPMVTVDGEDNIKVKGSGSFKIHINGKPSTLFANNPKEALKSLPATTVKKIELITNPSAKYDAEGLGGIINIITTKNLNGYNGSVYIGYDTRGNLYGGPSATIKLGKLGFSGGVGFSGYNNPASLSNSFRKNFSNQSQLMQNGSSEYDGKSHHGMGELSYDIDKYNLITGSFWLNGSNGESGLEQTASNYNAEQQMIEKYIRRNVDRYGWSGGDVGIDYQKTFKDSSDHILTISYKLSNQGNESNSSFGNESILNSINNAQRTSNNADNNEHTFQLDYVHPLKNKHSIEGGLKSILRRNGSDYSSFIMEDDSYVPDLTNSNSFQYNQNVYSVYTTYAYKFKKVGIKLGGRIEKTVTDASFSRTKENMDIGNNYLNFIPSLTINWQLGEMQSLGLSYTKRIERPGIWYLNPFINNSDKTSISKGNPNVEPALSHSFELSSNNFIKGSSINTTVYYRFSNNEIESYSTLMENGVLLNTFGNIGKRKYLGLSLNASAQAGKNLNFNFDASFEYTNATSTGNAIKLHNEGFNFNIWSYGSYKITKTLRFNMNLGYSAPQVTLQGKNGGWMHSSFGFSQQLLKDKMSINLSVSQPWQQKRRFFSEMHTDSFYQSSENYNVMRSVRLGVSYRFGKTNINITRKKRGISNDDVKGGGGGNSGGGQ
ncbi:outer membrane beta-barrel family protein [Solitalea lacus]|uniref:outer membrane beta-barrel family protein n=1 Tax=Solitalea lacus TaxID=2911172 RepID=UPI001EDB11C4|nr:outer membrane beta-barrel family protein [Solitalea lacus]UKJ07122.1 TonB-dependent receptor [Solitalea lacus]